MLCDLPVNIIGRSVTQFVVTTPMPVLASSNVRIHQKLAFASFSNAAVLSPGRLAFMTLGTCVSVEIMDFTNRVTECD